MPLLMQQIIETKTDMETLTQEELKALMSLLKSTALNRVDKVQTVHTVNNVAFVLRLALGRNKVVWIVILEPQMISVAP